MTEVDFLRMKENSGKYIANSLEYTDYEDVEDYEILRESDDLILLVGYYKDADCRKYHWASNTAAGVLNSLGKDNCLIEFVPEDWVEAFEQSGFVIRDRWMDYFKESLEEIPELSYSAFSEGELLKNSEVKEVSDVTMSCRGLSRGFMGMSEEWAREWITADPDGEEPVQKEILIARNEEQRIIGITATGIYGLNSAKGPTAWIHAVAVRPEYQNRGIARNLITRALGLCKSGGAVKAFLHADECNQNAIHLYQSIGFRQGSGAGQIDMIRE